MIGPLKMLLMTIAGAPRPAGWRRLILALRCVKLKVDDVVSSAAAQLGRLFQRHGADRGGREGPGSLLPDLAARSRMCRLPRLIEGTRLHLGVLAAFGGGGAGGALDERTRTPTSPRYASPQNAERRVMPAFRSPG